MKTILRLSVACAAGVLLGASDIRGAEPTADFKEVLQIVRERLAGATDESVNRAALEGLVAALKGRVTIVTNVVGVATNKAPLVSRQNVFDDGIGYVRVDRFGAGLASEVEAAVKGFGASNKLSGLVLDLRFAGGDDYTAATGVVDLFLKTEVPLLNAGKGLLSSHEKTNSFHFPVVALVNGETSEAAEALAAMLRQTGAGLLLGGRTSGRAGVREDFKLSNGQTLRLVVAPVLLGDAKPVPATGVVPDIEVPVKLEAEKGFYADGSLSSPASKTAASNGTNGVASGRSPKRVRVTEADLVREKRGDGDFETITNARVKAEPEVQVIQDPALARAVDLLKGLAVVRQAKN
ncbi:MAG: hypothetical protein RLY20_3321 [Verrucomicrobiota bacterium]|jgi:C-terminal processing protease CtpA/Prc